MFTLGAIEGVMELPIVCHEDQRGWIIELFRLDEVVPQLVPKMGYISQTLPGGVRGPHAHRTQSDYFAFLGPGDFAFYLWDAREASSTFRHRQRLTVGECNRRLLIVPPGVVHAYKNISDRPAWSLNFPNQLYAGRGRKDAVDEIRYEDAPGHPYLLDEVE